MAIIRSAALVFLLAPLARAEGGPQDEESKKKIEDLEKQVAGLVQRVKSLEDQLLALKKTIPGTAEATTSVAMSANEKNAALSLKMLATAEADFRKNDRDGNGIHDYWVGDVSGLYRYAINAKEIKLIDRSLADADASPLKSTELSVLKTNQPVPNRGYLFAALGKYVEKEKPEAYHSGGFRNNHHFGFAAYPAEYGKSGRLTFVISELNIVWRKDLGGKAPEALPENLAKDDWEKAD